MTLTSINPSTGEAVWAGESSTNDQLDAAVAAARAAQRPWAALGFAARSEVALAYAAALRAAKHTIAGVISAETGKPPWEAAAEVDAMIGKVAISIDAHRRRLAPEVRTRDNVTQSLDFRPHGVLAVLGPFNFPGHLPNGHIVPALLAGNTVVFKPSPAGPAVAEAMAAAWADAGLPPGVLRLVHGHADVATALASHRDIDGVLFTGSHTAGVALARLLADQPGRMLALEMGGNNPLVVWSTAAPAADLASAIASSAFATAGQRCSCARRLILPTSDTHTLPALLSLMSRLHIAPPTSPQEPFAGPLISEAAATAARGAQQRLIDQGAIPLRPMAPLPPRANFLSPGLLDVSAVPMELRDDEIFAPLLQLIRVDTFDAALAEANATRFGLAAAIFTDDAHLWHRFRDESRAGCVNLNRPTTGAASDLPFGGTGDSGNNRPSAYFAADYCAYPVASLSLEQLAPTALRGVMEPQMNADERR